MPNPIVNMTTGGQKYVAGFNPDGTTRFAYTDHDRNPTMGTLQTQEVIVTPQNGTIDDNGTQYLTIGGTKYSKMSGDTMWRPTSEQPLSGADPLAQFYVEGTALNPLFRWIGRGLQYPLAQMGNKTARTKIMERTFDRNFLPEGRMPSYGADGMAHNLFQDNRKITVNGTPVSNSLKKITTSPEGETPSIRQPYDWLVDWTEESGKRQLFSSKQIRREFNKAKQELLAYINGDEFKQRVINSGQFTNEEYPRLVSELQTLIEQSRFVGKQSKSGATNTPVTQNFMYGPYFYKHLGPSNITFSDFRSPTQLRADLWHELFHSIGGHNQYVIERHPLVRRLRRYNESINPTKLSSAKVRAGNTRAELDTRLKNDYPEWYAQDPDNAARFIDDERGRAEFLDRQIIPKPEEVRSRMAATLDRLRTLGYDTKELISDPGKFKTWIQEISDKRIHMPYDTQHLLETYDIDDLANYASKMLSTTGVIYLGASNNSK